MVLSVNQSSTRLHGGNPLELPDFAVIHCSLVFHFGFSCVDYFRVEYNEVTEIASARMSVQGLHKENGGAFAYCSSI